MFLSEDYKAELMNIANPYNPNLTKDLDYLRVKYLNYYWKRFNVVDKAQEYGYDLSDYPPNVYLEGRDIYNEEGGDRIGYILFNKLQTNTIIVYKLYFEFPPHNMLECITNLTLKEFDSDDIQFSL